MATAKERKVKTQPKAARVDLATENAELKRRLAAAEAKIRRLRDNP